MEPRKSRRRFLGLASAGASSALLLNAATGTADDPPKKDAAAGEKKLFRGTSKNANIQDALALAIEAASKSIKGADRAIQWTLKEISGREGGIAGFGELTVTIEVTTS